MAQMTIRRVGVLSIAKIEGFLMFIVGLIIGVIYGLTVIIFGAVIMSALAQRGEGQVLGGVSTIVVGILIMIVVSIFYGVMGFIGGAIGALIYNIAAGIVGGIELELEGGAPPQYAPPPAQQWSGNPYPAR